MSKTRILEAVGALNVGETEQLLSAKPSLLWVTDRRGQNLMVIACAADWQKLRVPALRARQLAELLLDKARDRQSRFLEASPVWHASARGQNPTLVKFLAARGAKVDGLFAAGWGERIPMLKLLISLGADLGEVIDDETPFLHCFKNSRFESAKWLLKAGSAVDFRDSKGKTALHYALERSFEPELVRLLMRHGAKPDVTDRDGISAALKASRKRDKAYLAALK